MEKQERISKRYEKNKICTDFFKGYDEVMNATYIPKYVSEADGKAYENRLAATPFYNLFKSIIETIANMTLSEDIKTGEINPETINLKNIDGKGRDINVFAREVLVASLVEGVAFISIETDENGAFLVLRKYEDLYYFYEEQNETQKIVFKDVIEVETGEFETEEKKRFIVFTKEGGYVLVEDEKVEEWSNNIGKVAVVEIKTGQEQVRMEYIPKLLDIAHLNKTLINNESRLSSLLSLLAAPIPIITGGLTGGEIGEDGEARKSQNITVGVRSAIRFDDPEQKLELLEPKGTGASLLIQISSNIMTKIEELSTSIIRKVSSRTVIDAADMQSKGNSILTDLATELENKLNNAIGVMYELQNAKRGEKDYIELGKNFNALLKIDNEIKNIMSMYDKGLLSKESALEQIKKTGGLDGDFNIDEEMARI